MKIGYYLPRECVFIAFPWAYFSPLHLDANSRNILLIWFSSQGSREHRLIDFCTVALTVLGQGNYRILRRNGFLSLVLNYSLGYARIAKEMLDYSTCIFYRLGTNYFLWKIAFRKRIKRVEDCGKATNYIPLLHNGL